MGNINPNNINILFFMQIPPPVHGVSTINYIVHTNEKIKQYFNSYLLRIKFVEKLKDIRRFSLKKIYIAIHLFFKLILTLKKNNPAVVYFSIMPVGLGFLRDFLYTIVIKSFRKKIIFHIHNIGIYENSKKIILKWMYRFVFSNSTIIHPSSVLLKREFRNIDLTNTNKFVIPNTCIQFTHTYISHEKPVNRIVKIVFLSNLLPEKGLIILLKALNHLSKEFSDFELNIYGNTYRKKTITRYNKYIFSNNLSDKIFIKGPCFNEEKEKIFYQSDIFIFPSYFSEECFPLVILEAMQAGLAIISTSVGAIPEIIDDGINGIIVKPKDYLQLASKIKLLANDEILRKKIGNKAKEKYFKHLSVNRFEENLLSVFNSVLKI